MEENVRISSRQRSFPIKLQESELFQDNEIDNVDNFVHFTLMVESELVKIEESLNNPKCICGIKEDLEWIEFYKSKKALLMHQRRYVL